MDSAACFHRCGKVLACIATIEGHADVAAEQMLNFDGALGRQLIGRAIEMRLERDAVFGQLAQFGQRHHLKPAGIGEDRAVPVHEAVQATQPRDALRRWAQHQVIGITQDNIGAGGFNRFRRHGFDGRRRAYRHEGRGADYPVRRMELAGAGKAFGPAPER